MRRTWIGAALVAAVTLATLGTTPAAGAEAVGAVYTASNNAARNEVLMFDRAVDGALAFVNAFPTGGTGSGNGLGNQGGIAMTGDGKFLIVVNAGSHDISVLHMTHQGLALTDRQPSGGLRPVSVTVNGRLVYVLNAGSAVGGSDSVVGFRLSIDGLLTQIPNSQRGLSAATTGPAQVSLSPDGANLIVTEKDTNRVDIFAVEESGLIGASRSYVSSGTTPFGFAFGKHDQFFVSEAFGGAADASAVSSYQVTSRATFSVISPSVPTTETSACWVTVSSDGRYLYTTNAASGTISGFSVRPNGTITRLDANGVTATTGPGVGDVTLTPNDRYLYALRSGAGAIAVFHVRDDGSLAAVGSIAVPAGTNGIVAR